MHATLPPGARFSCYRTAGIELWLAGDRDRFAYLVDAADHAHIKRWVPTGTFFAALPDGGLHLCDTEVETPGVPGRIRIASGKM